MSILDLLRKPIDYDFKSLKAEPLDLKSLGSVRSPFQLLSAPIAPNIVKETRNAIAPTEPKPAVTPVRALSGALPAKVIQIALKQAKALPGQVKTLFTEEESSLEKGLATGALNLVSNIKKFNEVFYETIGAKKEAAQMRESAATDKELAGYLANEGVQVNDPRTLAERLEDPEWFYRTLGQSAPSVLASVGVAVPAAMLGAPLAVAAIAGGTTAGAMIFGSSYDEAISEGVDPNKAKTIAAASAIGEGILEALPAWRVASKLIGSSAKAVIRRSFASNIVQRIVSVIKQGTLEGTTESLQEVYENALRKTYKDNQDLFANVAESGIFGAILGAGTDVAVETIAGGKEAIEKGRELYERITPEERQRGAIGFGEEKPETYYRGSPKKETEIKINTDSSLSYGPGVYLSDNSNIAKEYGENVMEIVPTKPLNLKQITEAERENIVDLYGQEQKNYINTLLEDGKYDGLKIPERAGDGNEVVIYDKNLLKIKEAQAEKIVEITDIINQLEELRSIPKGEKIADPDTRLPIADNFEISRQSLKHIAEKPAEFPSVQLIKNAPDILDNPSEIRKSNSAKGERNLYIKYAKGGQAEVVVTEGNSVVTVFTADPKYLSKMSIATPKGGDIGPSIAKPEKVSRAQKGRITVEEFEAANKEFVKSKKKTFKRLPKKAQESLTNPISSEQAASENLETYNRFQELIESNERALKYEHLQMERDNLAYTLSNHPGRNLIRYVSQTTGDLPEVTGRPFMKSLTGSGKKVRNSEFGKRGDEIVQHELGFRDLDHAEQVLKDYRNAKGRLDAMESALKAERPFIRERKALLRILDKQKVKGAEELPEPQVWARDGLLKDISTLAKSAKDIYRNTKTVFGERYKTIKEKWLDPFDASKGKYIDEQSARAKALKENVTEKLGIKKGSAQDQAIMDYGEKLIVADDLVQRYGRGRAEQLIEAERWFRNQYDSMLEEVNTIRQKIYPHNPEKQIPKRQDYFRHYQELAEGLGALKNIFETPAGISPALVGTSDFTAPRSKWLSFAQRRLGINTQRSAIGGYLNYTQAFAYAKHIDPQIGRFRALKRALVQGLEAPDAVRGTNLHNYLKNLDDFANDLAGKTNPLDRTIQEYFPFLGRQGFRAIDWLNRRVKANVILGNFSSSLAQIFNIPQGIGSAKMYSLPGMARTLGSLATKNAPMENSVFIKERFFRELNEFDTGLLKKPKKFAIWMITALDEAGTKFIWNSHYEKAIAQGMEDPIKYADDITRDMVGGRGIGEVPTAQKSRLFQMVAPFQLEVGNLWWVMKDFVKAKDFSALVILFITAYLMNRAAEEVRGTDVMFDPIDAALDGARILKEEEDLGKGLALAGGRVAGEVLSNVPLGQTIASYYPEYGFKVAGIETPTREQFFGQASDPTRFGTGLLLNKGLQDPLFKLLPPFAGNQGKKTYQGIKAWFNNAMEDKSGKKLYEVDRSLPNLLRVGLFGAYSTPEAREYFERTETPEAKIIRQEKEKAKQKTDTIREDAENMYRQMNKMPKNEAAETFKNLAAQDKEMAKMISDIAKEEARGLSYTDRQLLSAGVKNGARAKAIMRLLDKQDTKEGKAELWSDLVHKKIITKEVANQLNYLLKQ